MPQLTILSSFPLLVLMAGHRTVADRVSYERDVYPILERRCFECHGPLKQRGNMRFDTREGLMTEVDGFAPVVPGDPDTSMLLELVSLPGDDPDAMPPKGDRMADREIAILSRWISEGAEWTEVAITKKAPDPLVLPPLGRAEASARERAMAELRQAGYAVGPVAAGLHAVDFNGSLARDRFTDQELVKLQPLAPSLVWLNLTGTAVTNAGGGTLRRLKELRRLSLARTSFGDEGVASLVSLSELERLNLYGTSISDAGLLRLAALPKLKKLYLWQTRVTDAGAAAFAASRPDVLVNRGVPAPEADPVNNTCPVSGLVIHLAHTSDYEGRRIAFHCAACKAVFDAHPEAFVGALPVPKPTGKEPGEEAGESAELNAVCPLNGDPAVAAHISDFEGSRVAFCCSACKARFDQDPAAFANAVHRVRAGVVRGAKD